VVDVFVPFCAVLALLVSPGYAALRDFFLWV
jgi:hypothetical protein